MQNANLKKYFFPITIISTIVLTIGLLLLAFNLGDSDFSNSKLIIPEILEYKEEAGIKKYEIDVNKTNYEFVEGVASKTYGFSGEILGPTIRFDKGDKVEIKVNNNLDEKTTTHWHGALLPDHADGGVHNIIPAGEEWVAKFEIVQEAATLWYHPHQHEETARQVYNGLGGMIIIDDENSKDLELPDQYGVDDFPIIIQSKNLDDNGKLRPYKIGHHEEVHGLEGNTVMINAQIDPYIDAQTNLIRLRVLNASNSDLYEISLSNSDEFYVIASDGGFYEKPIKVSELEISTGKRFEILLNIEDLNEDIWLNVNNEPELEIRKAKDIEDKYKIPNTLNEINEYLYGGQIDFEIIMEFLRGPRQSMLYGINGKLFDMNRIDLEVPAESVQYWKISNEVGGGSPFHPFHIHATQFQIVEFNGESPNELMQGYHDTIFLRPNDEAILAVPFHPVVKGVYMYHCHILEHEDAGMMGQFEVR